ncbi:MAG: undecaprenyl-phosphate glucose phosphotransferase [Burkholderiales bacterium]|nr:undecaprenyl-phosphate glucose phosphotransferase [Burkholderiales bacterium]MDP2398612.1 undecaprenyl-phosphate glucose phosphotransferase [Burkholderiales bacterium]
MPPHAVPLIFRSPTRISVGRDQLLNLFETLLDPMVLVFTLWGAALWINGHLQVREMVLSVIVFAMTFPGYSRLAMPLGRALRNIALGWVALSALLLLFGFASHSLAAFNPQVLQTWWWTALVGLGGAHVLLRTAAPKIRKLQGPPRRVVIAGMNEQGIELANRLANDLYSNVRVVGFFDDRSSERLKHFEKYAVLGKLQDLPEQVKKQHIDGIYLSLPMASQPRILSLLDGLRDTTGSIYFVPDSFVTDLIQGRMDTVGGIPVVAICETPFTGFNRILKRGSDIVLSTLILLLILPLLLAIALAIRLTSPGPVIFRQRRYGLDGREIVVYKFRSMVTTDDGNNIRQATKSDPRLTPLGAILRRTSLDELPQFINVLQGRMSIVGPRPHAVAHNEMYRKLIKGYMLRHKVQPGISGWAQVNGCRGETETLDKMKARIDCDLEYLRHWSLRLDLYIIARTIWVVLKGDNAH